MQEIASSFHKRTFMVNETLWTNCLNLGLMQHSYQKGLLLERLAVMDPALVYPVRTMLHGMTYKQQKATDYSFEMREWCDEHITGKWGFLFGSDFAAFETQEDAMIFRMVWG